MLAAGVLGVLMIAGGVLLLLRAATSRWPDLVAKLVNLDAGPHGAAQRPPRRSGRRPGEPAFGTQVVRGGTGRAQRPDGPRAGARVVALRSDRQPSGVVVLRSLWRHFRPGLLAALALVLIVGGCLAISTAGGSGVSSGSGSSSPGYGAGAPVTGAAPAPASNSPTWTGLLRVTSTGFDMSVPAPDPRPRPLRQHHRRLHPRPADAVHRYRPDGDLARGDRPDLPAVRDPGPDPSAVTRRSAGHPLPPGTGPVHRGLRTEGNGVRPRQRPARWPGRPDARHPLAEPPMTRRGARTRGSDEHPPVCLTNDRFWCGLSF